jgi:7-cyano-7-deazaguanine synthase
MRKSARNKAVILLSGGIDSSTVLAIAKSCRYDLYALSFDYHQRHRRELESAKLVAKSFGVKEHLIITFDLREIGGSALTSGMEVPKSGVRALSYGISKKAAMSSPVPSPQSPIPVTYVPARNTIFLSFALGWAEVLEAGDIFIGATAVDYSGYPDCRPEYLKAFEDMANLATKASVEGNIRFRINAPLLSMTKKEIIKKGISLGLDYSLTWSCYDPQPLKGDGETGKRRKGVAEARVSADSPVRRFSDTFLYVPCGRCDSCGFRKKGFKEAGIKDPLLSV